MDDTMSEKENKGYRYILTCIDLFSRYAFVIPMKSKTGIETAKAIEQIIKKEKANPEKFWTDSGAEFYNKDVDKLREKYNIDIYSTYGVAKAAVIERFNKSFKELLYKQFTINGNRKWFNILDDILDIYNNRSHRSLNNKSPNDVYKNNNNDENNIILEDLPDINKSKFKVNDRVRITYKKGVFDKGYLAKWSYEIFIITDVLNTKPITYKLKSEDDNEPIKGSFYSEEIQKTK
jgi:predicted MPP superfamily phosphohydrolase